MSNEPSVLDFIPPAKPIIGEDEVEAVSAVLRSGMVAQGPQVAAFEEEFSEELVDGVFAVAVNSGTSALHLALLASGVGPGDEVIVPSFTFAATANSVAITGATPVFVDIEEDFFCMDPAAAEAAITERTKAICRCICMVTRLPWVSLRRLLIGMGLLCLRMPPRRIMRLCMVVRWARLV